MRANGNIPRSLHFNLPQSENRSPDYLSGVPPKQQFKKSAVAFSGAIVRNDLNASEDCDNFVHKGESFTQQ